MDALSKTFHLKEASFRGILELHLAHVVGGGGVGVSQNLCKLSSMS